MKITAAPTLTSIADGSVVIAVEIPIQLDWDRVTNIAGRQTRSTITDAIGILQLTMSLVANIVSQPETARPGGPPGEDASTMTIQVQLITDATAAESPRLTLAANSPVRLTSPVQPGQFDGTAALIQNAIAQQYQNSLSWAISPQIQVPIGNLEVRHADVVTSGGVLIAGVQVVGTQGTGNPSGLISLLPDSSSNIFVQVQEVVANLLIQSALNSGALLEAATQLYSNAAVDSASASFQNSGLVVQVNGRLVHECPLHVDLRFIYTRTVTVKVTEDPITKVQAIEIDQANNPSIAEWGNLWCLLTTLGLIGLAVVGGGILDGFHTSLEGGILAFVVSGVGPFLLSQVFGGGGGNPPVLIDLSSPIPGSDYLPILSGGAFQVTNGAMLIAATAGLLLDNINTVIYVRFLGPAGGVEVAATKPLAGVTVALMDQDVPAPAGDDTMIAIPATTVVTTGDVVNTTKYTFQAPTADQMLAQGKTDLDGVVRFALSLDQLTTTAGSYIGVSTISDTHTGAERTGPPPAPIGVPELKPDLYFLVTMPDCSVADTRSLTGGFMPNFTSQLVGTLSNPLTFSFVPSLNVVKTIG